jgi:hypothetical protein
MSTGITLPDETLTDGISIKLCMGTAHSTNTSGKFLSCRRGRRGEEEVFLLLA